MYFLYTAVSLVLFVAFAPYFAYQALRYRKYVTNLRQRLGYLPVSFNVDGEPSIWIHAVSVGETLTARALAGDLKRRYPRLRLFVSTTTIAEMRKKIVSNLRSSRRSFARSCPDLPSTSSATAPPAASSCRTG